MNSSTYDLDRAGLDAALTVLLDLGVAEAVGFAGHLATPHQPSSAPSCSNGRAATKEGDANKLMDLRLPTRAQDTIDSLRTAAGAASRSQRSRAALALCLGEG